MVMAPCVLEGAFMSKLHLALVVPLALLATFAGACAPARSALPADARVEILQTERLVLHGTASASPAGASCTSAGAAGSRPVYLQLNEQTNGNILLRPTAGVAVLHVEELATNRTWCVMTHADGTGAAIPADFPGGVFAISVEASRAAGSLPFEVVFERL